jgi:hypothetical protein
MRSGGKMHRLIDRKQTGREKTVMKKQMRALQNFVANAPKIKGIFVLSLNFDKNYFKTLGLFPCV